MNVYLNDTVLRRQQIKRRRSEPNQAETVGVAVNNLKPINGYTIRDAAIESNLYVYLSLRFRF